MVEMGMGEQDAVEPTKPEPAPEQLALRALTTVDQEPAVAVQYDERWQPSINSRHTGSRAEENDFEQATLAARTRCGGAS
jgi:hypothetical protein